MTRGPDADIAVLKGVAKNYRAGQACVPALKGVDLRLRKGERVAIVGRSGSGKSTLMNVLGLLDTPSAGHYTLDGRATSEMLEPERALLRNRRIGFVFQQFHLLPHLSATQNVELPMLYGQVPQHEREQRARECLNAVGLSHRMGHHPAQMSGGERQRVAVARALVMRPALLLADEPTGALDTEAGNVVVELLTQLCESQKTTLVVVTHDPDLAARMPRQVRMRDGRIEHDSDA